MMLQTLRDWTAEGWLRRLDSAFAAFLADLRPQSPPELLLAAALLAHLEGRGHSCLHIEQLLAETDALLAWPPAGLLACRAALAAGPADAAAWAALLRRSPLVDSDSGTDSGTSSGASSGTDNCATDRNSACSGNAPMVMRGQRLFLRRYWRYERDVAAQVLQRGSPARLPDPSQARRWLDRLFDSPSADAGPCLDWQKIACSLALRGRLTVITGGPGTGKTYTAARLLALLLAMDPAPAQLRIALAAPTGKAAARLGQSIAAALHDMQQRLSDAPGLADLLAHIPPARTLHALLGARPDTRAFRADAAHPLAVDVLIVDEASMVHLEMMAVLLAALPATARVVLLGDKDQLASVEAGAVLGDLCRDAERGRYGVATADFVQAVSGECLPRHLLGDGPPLAQQTVMLRRSRRFSGSIGRLALAVNAGDVATATQVLLAHAQRNSAGNAPVDADDNDDCNSSSNSNSNFSDGSVAWLQAKTPADAVRVALDGRAGATGGFAGQGSYAQLLSERPPLAPDAQAARQAFDAWAWRLLKAFDRCRVLCAVREGPWGAPAMNTAIERALVDAGHLQRHGPWYEGRPVMVTRNDAELDLFNGDIGIALKLPTAPGATSAAALRVVFPDGQGLRSVSTSRLAQVETAFAMTVHKSQGSEFKHAVLVLPAEPSRVLTRELVYTGITRAQHAFTLVTGRSEALGEALTQRTVRGSGLPDLLG